MVYSFCNPNERTCKHLIGLKTETGKYYACVMTYDARNEMFFPVNKSVINECPVILKHCFHSAYVKWSRTTSHQSLFKGIVHFAIKIWYLSAYPKGIQDVGVFFSSVDPILMFLGQTVLVGQSYNGRYRSLSL